jgi:hypothetical protein
VSSATAPGRDRYGRAGMWRSLVSAPALGAGGRGFESRHPDSYFRMCFQFGKQARSVSRLSPDAGRRGWVAVHVGSHLVAGCGSVHQVEKRFTRPRRVRRHQAAVAADLGRVRRHFTVAPRAGAIIRVMQVIRRCRVTWSGGPSGDLAEGAAGPRLQLWTVPASAAARSAS